MNRNALVATTALAVLCAPLIVRAQAAPTQAPADSSAATPRAGEVVVQAQRRSEILRNVPVSVTAINASELKNAGIDTTTSLTMLTPGLEMPNEGLGSNQVTIRGVSSIVGESNNVIYIDNADQSFDIGNVYNLPDVESVQVLKGPQGTLFGRNATGGAILITTRAPSLTRPQGDFSVSYGNYNSLQLKAFFTAPIIQDKLAFSVSGLWYDTDGWKTNVTTGCKTCAGYTNSLVRAKLRFDPWAGADFILTAIYSEANNKNALATTSFMGDSNYEGLPGANVASRPYTYASSNLVYNQKQFGAELHGDIDAGPGKISITTYYTHLQNTFGSNATNLQLPGASIVYETPYEFTQEILYTTNQIGMFHATGGFFYYDRYDPINIYVGGGTIATQAFDISAYDRARSYSAFGDVTADITDQFSVTFGLRYNNEWASADAYEGAAPIPSQALWGVKNFLVPFTVRHHTWNSWTPKVTAVYKITPRTNVYFNFSQGFKTGTFNAENETQGPVQPESINAFELGVKSDEFQNVSFSVAGFYYDYSNLQVDQVIPETVMGHQVGIEVISNAAKAQIYGVELNAQWRATENFDLSAGATFISAKYTSYPGAQFLTPHVGPYSYTNPISSFLPPVNCPTGVICGNTATFPNIGGTNLLYTPPWSGNVMANYHRDFAVGRLDASATLSVQGKTYWDYGNHLPQNPYVLLNGTLGFRPAGTNLHLSLWVKNLTGTVALSQASGSTSGYTVDYTEPRTFGVAAEFTF